MDDGRGDGGPLIRERIDRLRRSATVGDTPPGSGPDVVTALTACIRTTDRGAARTLALAWLDSAEVALTAGGEQGALVLLARVLGVPAAYFTDPDTTRVVDGGLRLAAGTAPRGVATRGPCRTGVPSRGVDTVRERLLRELERAD
ncbi:hypothetical protein [Pseudonocardia endophytica]|uniref:Uncharacterized protein n=1 Tax=Pseudonocardia endophytica TaxID=401976 RepID=A0A4R1HXR9_PSEEN|nr:hypothetical protein [Pseudonocardia endophytica]TCK22352.1 hypothetical protein EV378_6354 [Pseudonocardia endophytica]